MLWTANTERYSEVIEGLNDTADNLMKSIDAGEAGEPQLERQHHGAVATTAARASTAKAVHV